MYGNGKVFISHAHDDTDLCAPLVAALDAWGIDYWFDIQRMDAGQDLLDSVQEAIAERDIFIRVCTRGASDSFWMNKESGAFLALQAAEHRAGLSRRRRLIPLRTDAAYQFKPFELATLYIDAFNHPQRIWYAELRRALGLRILDVHTASAHSDLITFGGWVRLQATNGAFLSSHLDHDGRLFAGMSGADQEEIFQFVEVDNPVQEALDQPVRYGDRVGLRSHANGCFVGVALDKACELVAQVPWLRSWETFAIVRPPLSSVQAIGGELSYGDRFALIAVNGKTVRCALDEDQRIVADVSHVRDHEVITVLKPA